MKVKSKEDFLEYLNKIGGDIYDYFNKLPDGEILVLKIELRTGDDVECEI